MGGRTKCRGRRRTPRGQRAKSSWPLGGRRTKPRVRRTRQGPPGRPQRASPARRRPPSSRPPASKTAPRAVRTLTRAAIYSARCAAQRAHCPPHCWPSPLQRKPGRRTRRGLRGRRRSASTRSPPWARPPRPLRAVDRLDVLWRLRDAVLERVLSGNFAYPGRFASDAWSSPSAEPPPRKAPRPCPG